MCWIKKIQNIRVAFCDVEIVAIHVEVVFRISGSRIHQLEKGLACLLYTSTDDDGLDHVALLHGTTGISLLDAANHDVTDVCVSLAGTSQYTDCLLYTSYRLQGPQERGKLQAARGHAHRRKGQRTRTYAHHAG